MKTNNRNIVVRSDVNLDWLDEVAPLPVRPSSPVNIRQTEPVKIIVEKSKSDFNKLNGTLQEIVDRRRLLDENVQLLERQHKAQHTSLAFDIMARDDSVKEKVSKAIASATNIPTGKKITRHGVKSKASSGSDSVPKKRNAVKPKRSTKVIPVELPDAKLRSIYGRSEWEMGHRRIKNPFLHYQSPPKHHTNVQLSQSINVRSQKQQTTPRLAQMPQHAIQIAPPVRAGPTNRNQSPFSTTSSITSELLSSTPIHSKASQELNESAIDASIIIPDVKIKADKNTSAMPRRSPSPQPHLLPEPSPSTAAPPVIIKPSYLQSKSANQLNENKIDELKGWMQKEFLSRMVRQEENQIPRIEVIPPQHHRKLKSMTNVEDEEALKRLIEDKFRQLLRERNAQKSKSNVVIPPPVVKEESVVSEESIFFEPKPIEIQHFVDETIQDCFRNFWWQNIYLF